MQCDEILATIDETLDRLIVNAEAMSKNPIQSLTEVELRAFEKTQESLISHLVTLDHLLLEKSKTGRRTPKKVPTYKIQEKLLKFEKLNNCFVENFSQKTKQFVAK